MKQAERTRHVFLYINNFKSVKYEKDNLFEKSITYAPDCFQAFKSGTIQRHLLEKWKSYADKDGGSRALYKMIFLLDKEKSLILIDWILKNYPYKEKESF